MNENPPALEPDNEFLPKEDCVTRTPRDSLLDASSDIVQNFLNAIAKDRQILAAFKSEILEKSTIEVTPELLEELDAYIQEALESDIAESPEFAEFSDAVYADLFRSIMIQYKYSGSQKKEHEETTPLEEDASLEGEATQVIAGSICLFQGTTDEFRRLYAEMTNPVLTNDEALATLRDIAQWDNERDGAPVTAATLAPTLDAIHTGFGKPYILKLISGLIQYKFENTSNEEAKMTVRDLSRFVLRQFAHEVKNNQLNVRKNIRKVLGENLLHATEKGSKDPLQLLVSKNKKQAVQLYRETLLPNYHLELANARQNGGSVELVKKRFKAAVYTEILPLLDLPPIKEDVPLSVLTHMRNLIKEIPISLGKLPKLSQGVQESEDTIQRIIEKNTNKIWYSKKMEEFFEELSIWAKVALSHKKKYWDENNLFGLAVTADHFFRKIAFMSKNAEENFPEVYVDWNHNRANEGIEFGTIHWDTDAWKPAHDGHRPTSKESSFLHEELRRDMEEHKRMLKHDQTSGKFMLRQEEQLLKMLLRSVVEEKVRHHYYGPHDAQALAAAPVAPQEEAVSLAS